MNWFDLIALIVLIRSSYIGFRRGLSMELFRFLGLIVSGFASFYYYERLGDILTLNTSIPQPISNAVCFIVILLLGIALFKVLGSFTRKVMQLSFTANFDSIGGAVCGLLKGAIIASFIVVLLQQIPSEYISESIELKSFSGRYFVKFSSNLYSLINRIQPEGLNL